MKLLQIMIEVLFVLKRYNHIRCIQHKKPLQIMIEVLLVLEIYNHVKCTA